MTKKIPKSLGTHNGSFHADEVTACALLLLFEQIDEDKIFRTRDRELLDQCEIVCDVGGIYDPKSLRFDHHQKEYAGSLSSAGMVLLHLKESGILQAKDFNFFNEALIIGVDAHDNGKDLAPKGVCTYSHIIANYNPIHHDASNRELDDAFFEALKFSKNYLLKLWTRRKYIHSCRQQVQTSMKTELRYLVFEKNIPWLDSFFELGGEEHKALFVIMPSGEHWKLRGIPPSPEQKMDVRLPFPKHWAGLMGEELRAISGIEGAIFCHKGRFISVWETKESALDALFKLLESEEEDI